MSKQDKKELRQQIACEWLEENYLNYGSLRHDVVTDRLQIRMADSLSAPHNATSVIGDPAEDGSAYSLRAPHNATSVIGDPAEFRGGELLYFTTIGVNFVVNIDNSLAMLAGDGSSG